jgi:hypothetical protein
VNALGREETNRKVMNVHLVVLLDSGEQVIACRHFLETL